jgi:taurine transport system permease protein
MALDNNQNNKKEKSNASQNTDKTISRESNRNKKSKTERALTFFTWASIFILWYVITKLGIFTPTLLPGPARV